jgi:Mg2+ and Co2+ transporter CorA
METATEANASEATIHHEPTHHRLVEEIATRVEERLVAKFARWLVVNLFIVLGLLATVIGTYYSLDNRITETKRVDELQDRLLMSHQQDNHQLRNDIMSEMRDLKRGQDEINRFLRDHNTEMNARLKKVP